MDQLYSVLGWGSAIGTGFFMIAVAMTLLKLAKTIETLSKIDKDMSGRK